MKWCKPPELIEGEQRTVRRFLWFPKCLNREWRWLEFADIRQKVVKFDVGGSMQWGYYKNAWHDIAWGNSTCS